MFFKSWCGRIVVFDTCFFSIPLIKLDHHAYCELTVSSVIFFLNK